MTMQFEPIQLDRQSEYRERLARCGQTASDYSFINLWGWQEEYELTWAWQDGLVWIKQERPHRALWAPVGDWQAVEWPNAFAEAKETSGQMIRVPHTLLTLLERRITFQTPPEETRDHWDYLYSIEALIELKGNRFHKKKNLVNQFKRNYEFAYLGFGPELIEQASAMQEDWCAWRDCESNDTLTSENNAIARVLKDWRTLSAITGGGLLVEGTIVAYTIAEIMPDHTLVIHFEKGCPDIKGGYQAINQMFLANAPKGPTIVNREQDIGDQGLRKAKLSYHPVDFIKKYKIEI
ncbi:MAG: DUF2156 domain-containing protein [Desulfatitalea sp.]|nr:DUF2156 domain-containing protein [Desulfatitalea sp.]NNK00717.1 DUF2156 domain-containing protein [Desulfatitalea sp.]